MADPKLTTRHIGELKHGDTVLHRGDLVTVSASNLRRGGFMGTTLLGDSYRMGTEPVIVADVQWQRPGSRPDAPGVKTLDGEQHGNR